MHGRQSIVLERFGLVAGLLRDGLPVLANAWTAWRGQPTGEPRSSFASVLADAALPARAEQRRVAREEERARLAADLHATVLPELRRAAAAAAAASGETVPDDVRAGLRRALEDVEQLMHGRQSIVLERFGLVAALEWLAERAEQAGQLRVELALEGDDVDRRDAVPPEVARAAFRIALLAIDNVARHAHATVATIGLRVDRRSIELSIADDGTAPDAPAGGGSGRGLADIRREADATGARLALAPPPGMTITATWARPGAA
jgi:signal transduction histidine kinase